MTDLLDQYADMVDDAPAFKASCQAPLPETCWMPPDHHRALSAFPSAGLSPLSWTREGFRIDDKDQTFGIHFLTGGLLIQEEAAMMAIRALDPAPGERILDLCAAPGNKTVQLASAVGPAGCVVANDVSASRLQILRGLVDRFKLTNVLMTVHDGTSFPEREFEGIEAPGLSGTTMTSEAPMLFDAVLADVPCSCEGTCRKNPSVLTRTPNARRAALPVLQEKLLRKAIRMTRPGGRILYATCTFAPEENEAVVDRVLMAPRPGQRVDIEPIRLPAVKAAPGITSWNGKALAPELEGAVRIWPHHNDTGGFFLALLRKHGSYDLAWPARRTDRPLDGSVLPWSAYAPGDAFLKNHVLVGSGRKHNRLVSSWCPPLPLNVVSIGMSGLNLKSRDPRPSSSLAGLLTRHARAGIAELTPSDVLPFLRRETIDAADLIPPLDRTRFVLVRCGELGLGLGHVNRTGGVESLFPAHLAGLPVTEWLDRLSGG